MTTPKRGFLKVYNEFERRLPDGRMGRFLVQDASEDVQDALVEFMMGNYIREEVWCAAAGTAKDPTAIQEYRTLLSSVVKDKMSTACYLVADDGRTLVGASVAMLQKRDTMLEHKPPFSNAGLRTLRMFVESMKITALYDKYGVDQYLMGAGLSVAPEYRGLGLAVAMLEARKVRARELGIKVTGGIFTGASSQRSAERAGWELAHELPYREFSRLCGFNIDTTTPFLRIYGSLV